MVNTSKRLIKVVFKKKGLYCISPLLYLDILISKSSLGSQIQSPAGMQFINRNSSLSLELLNVVSKILEQFSVWERDL